MVIRSLLTLSDRSLRDFGAMQHVQRLVWRALATFGREFIMPASQALTSAALSRTDKSEFRS